MRPRECPKCHGLLEDDGSCSCGYGVKRRTSAVTQHVAASVILCSYVDHGRPCACRGIISHGTNGGGNWYCREHWETVHDREPGCVGNAPGPIPKRPTEKQAIKSISSELLKPSLQWLEGETYKQFRERLSQHLASLAESRREPGSDDDIEQAA